MLRLRPGWRTWNASPMPYRPPGEVPPHYRPESVETCWRVPYEERASDARAWAAEHGIRPSGEDEFRTALLLVDCQNTFCLPGFELFVGGRSGRGAVEDNKRLCAFIYRNLHSITEIIPTLDTHTAQQVFHPVFWVDRDGRHPTGGETVITPDDVEAGTWRVNPAVEAWYSGAGRSFSLRIALRPAPHQGRQESPHDLALPRHARGDRPRPGVRRGGGGVLPRHRPGPADALRDQGEPCPHGKLLRVVPRSDGRRRGPTAGREEHPAGRPPADLRRRHRGRDRPRATAWRGRWRISGRSSPRASRP